MVGHRSTGFSRDESQRLAAIHRYRVRDIPDGAFDRVCSLAARFCNVPIATVAVVDEDRVWLKARRGLDATELPRGPGLCASAVLADEPYVVTDAAADPRAFNNPLVRGELGLRFYAAAPIITQDGYRLGTVNVIDTEPRDISSAEIATLQDLAGVVADEIELRLSSLRAVGHEQGRRAEAQRDSRHLAGLADTLRRSLLPPRLPSVPGVDLAAHHHPASSDDIGGDFYDVFPAGGGSRWNLVLGDVCGKGPEAAALTSLVRYTLRTASILNEDPVAALEALNEAMLLEGENPGGPRFCTVVCAQVERTEAGVRLIVADGGHPPVLVLRSDGSIEEVKGGGMLVGCVPHAKFAAVDVDLDPGDAVLFYTDGITDARLRDRSFFGTDGLTYALTGYAGRSADDVIIGLKQLVAGFDPPPGDDVALLALRPDGQPSWAFDIAASTAQARHYATRPTEEPVPET